MLLSLALSVAVRALQALLEAAPTLLFGILLAGILRTVTGPARLRQAFAGRGWSGMLRASAWGSLIPVCSLGVVPLIEELRRARVPIAQVLAFALAAPMLNPITIMYGFTILEFPVFLLIISSTLVISFVAGLLTSRWTMPAQSAVEAEPVPVAWGLRRMANALLAAARISTGPVVGAAALALLVSGLAASAVPEGFLSKHLKYTNPAAPPLMATVALPAFISPATGIMQVATLAKIQFSLGAAVALHILGVGVNVSILLWVKRQFGARRLLALLLVIVATTLLIGYAADATLPHPEGSEDDTHALDVFTQPGYVDLLDLRRAAGLAVRDVPVSSFITLGMLGTLMLAGVVIRIAKIEDLRDDPQINAQAASAGVLSRPMSPRALVATGVGVLLTTFVLVVYVYYPPLDQLFEDMNSVRANAITAVRTGQRDVALRELQQWDALAGKLTMSAALRRVGTDPNSHEAAVELRRQLAALLAAVREGKSADSLAGANQVMRVYQQCKGAFRQEKSS